MGRFRALIENPVAWKRAIMAMVPGGSIIMLNHWVVGIQICEGNSMQPTLPGRVLLLTEKLSYYAGWKTYKVGDVVSSRSKINNNEGVGKRIGGISGDLIVYVDLETTKMVVQEVGADHVWLEGDNVLTSEDSKVYGPVPLSLLRGRAFFGLGLKPLKFLDLDRIPEANQFEYSPKDYYWSKSYNLTNPGNLQYRDWIYLHKFLTNDELCANISPEQRKKLQQLVKSKLRETRPTPAAGTNDPSARTNK